MKKFFLIVSVVISFVMAVSVSAVGFKLELSYNEEKNVVSAGFGIDEGNSIAGHLGVSYNTEKLQIVGVDLESLPEVLPEKTPEGDSYIEKIVSPASENIIVTPEVVPVSTLINKNAGLVAFGWYAHKEVDCINAGESVATIYFKLVEGVSISDITSQDIQPATKEKIGNISGWGSGLMVADKDSKMYFYEPGGDALKMSFAVKANFINQEDIPSQQEDNDDSKVDDTTTETPKEDGQKVDDTTTETPQEDGQKVDDVDDKKEESVITADFDVTIRAYSDRIRVLWNKPADLEVSEYRILLTDNDNAVVRAINGITNVTRSVTIKELPQDYGFKVVFAGVKSDGTVVYNNNVGILRTQKDEKASARIYSVRYKAGYGTIYGISEEQVVFGGVPTKAPVVYAENGYEFSGWSVDGKNVIDVTKLKVFSDMTLTAVYNKK